MDAIAFKNISSDYVSKKKHTIALDGVSFSLEQGSFGVVLGPSGCGKSTLLSLLLGKQPYEGDIFLFGKDIESIPLRERGIAYIGQAHFLYPNMTVYDNIAFPLKLAGNSYSVIDEKVLSIAEKLGITLLLSRKPRQISGGQQQKVALAKAMVSRARLYVFDEPFSNLDPQAKSALHVLLLKLSKEIKATFLFVTHDVEEAFCLATHLYVMNEGKVVESGKTLDVINHPRNIFTMSFFAPYINKEVRDDL